MIYTLKPKFGQSITFRLQDLIRVTMSLNMIELELNYSIRRGETLTTIAIDFDNTIDDTHMKLVHTDILNQWEKCLSTQSV